MPQKVKKRYLLDYSILIPYLVLSVVGLIMIYSSTSAWLVTKDKLPTIMIRSQLQFWLLGLVGMFFIYKIKTSVFRNKYIITTMIVVIAFLLVLVLIIANELNGSAGWMFLAGSSIQPAEYLKIIMIWYLAYILEKKQESIGKDLKTALKKPILLVLALIFLVAIQPDLGNATVLILILIVMLLASGINYMYTYVIGGVGILASVSIIVTLIATNGKLIPSKYQYVYKRFAIFLNPFKDETGDGLQLANSYYAIDNGGWFGKGLGNSIQKKGFLPEAHSDFIFAITIEELGLLASLLILGLLIFFIARIILVGVKSNIPFHSLMCYGIGMMFLLQLSINLGGITGLIPLTGITFPFLSHGGNSMLINSIAVAFVLNISAKERMINIQESVLEVN